MARFAPPWRHTVKPPSPRLLARWGVTLVLGAAGGLLALSIGAPLPWLLGPLTVTGLAAAFRLPLFGDTVAFPMTLRAFFIPVVGVLIGAAMTPEVLVSAPRWWPGLASMVVFVALAHAANHLWLRRVGRLSGPTAFHAAMPGGLLEAIELGEKRGADVGALTVLQFARIALTVTIVPLVFTAVEGRAVGSGAGLSLARAGLGLTDAAILVASGVVGVYGARLLRAPAAAILGPILVSGAVHALGWTTATPPDWLVALAQLVIGVTLGLRFVGVAPQLLARYLALSAGSVAIMLALGGMFSLALSSSGFAPFGPMFLSYAPGGLVEMGLIAVSLEASPIFVTAHHLVRIVATVWVAAVAWRWSRRA